MDEMTKTAGLEQRAATGISAFDDIMSGGFARGHMYLLEGEPGAGKTTLALQFLMAGVKLGERVLYITLSESQQELKFVAQSHGWNVDGIDVMELSYLDDRHKPESQYTVFDAADVELGDTMNRLREQVETIKPQRVVVDSLSEVKLLARDPLRFRREILFLKQYFLQQEATVLLLDDRSQIEGDIHIQSLVHGVVRLERIANELGSERRRLLVSKLRGSNYRGGFHDYKIETGGIRVFPRLIAAEHRAAPLPGVLESGVANFDSILGGGIACGTSALVLGPAGTGKSTIVTMYAISAAKRGENVSMFLFDENVGTLLLRCEALNMPLQQYIDEGLISIQQIDPAEMSPGEFIQIIRDAIEHRDVRVLVIDSLIGLINAMPEEKMLISQLHELLSYLNQVGVTSLLTMVQHGIIGTMAAPADLSYLADTLVLLRYFEAEGEVKQALSIMKKRTGQHERTIREIQIGQGGVVVGEPLKQFHGVLTGVPQYKGDANPLMKSEASGVDE